MQNQNKSKQIKEIKNQRRPRGPAPGPASKCFVSVGFSVALARAEAPGPAWGGAHGKGTKGGKSKQIKRNQINQK